MASEARIDSSPVHPSWTLNPCVLRKTCFYLPGCCHPHTWDEVVCTIVQGSWSTLLTMVMIYTGRWYQTVGGLMDIYFVLRCSFSLWSSASTPYNGRAGVEFHAIAHGHDLLLSFAHWSWSAAGRWFKLWEGWRTYSTWTDSLLLWPWQA